MQYSIVGIVGILMLFKKWDPLYQGSYFWVKFIQSYFNVYTASLMLTLNVIPFQDMMLSVCAFVLDQYLCVVIYSLWQVSKEYQMRI